MQILHSYGYKWEDYFTWGTYIYQDLYDVPESWTDDNFQFLHGVNVGEGEFDAFTHSDRIERLTL